MRAASPCDPRSRARPGIGRREDEGGSPAAAHGPACEEGQTATGRPDHPPVGSPAGGTDGTLPGGPPRRRGRSTDAFLRGPHGTRKSPDRSRDEPQRVFAGDSGGARTRKMSGAVRAPRTSTGGTGASQRPGRSVRHLSPESGYSGTGAWWPSPIPLRMPEGTGVGQGLRSPVASIRLLPFGYDLPPPAAGDRRRGRRVTGPGRWGRVGARVYELGRAEFPGPPSRGLAAVGSRQLGPGFQRQRQDLLARSLLGAWESACAAVAGPGRRVAGYLATVVAVVPADAPGSLETVSWASPKGYPVAREAEAYVGRVDALDPSPVPYNAADRANRPVGSVLAVGMNRPPP